MLAGAHHLLTLTEMHLGRRREDHRVGPLDPFREIARVMLDAILLRHLRGRVLIAADERGDFHTGDTLQGVEMFLAERALPGNADPHAAFLVAFLALVFLGAAFALFRADFTPFSRMMWPTAVFDAGTV